MKGGTVTDPEPRRELDGQLALPVAVPDYNKRSDYPATQCAGTSVEGERVRAAARPHPTKPRLLDLCCSAGGAARGYQLAGFHVTGVDIDPQPNYVGDDFHQADALTFPLDGFDVVHASPPCQRYIRGGLSDHDKHPDLLPPIRERLRQLNVPWVIENVPGAPMRSDAILCGSQFGLAVRRHRWFEFDTPRLVLLPPCDHSRPVAGVYGHPHGQAGAWPGMLPSTLESWSAAMGIDWMNAHELAEAIPPSYTEWVGGQLLASLEVAA